MSLATILMPILILSGPLFPDIIVTLASIFYLKMFGKNFIELIKTTIKKGSYKKDINNIRNSLKNNELGNTFKFSLYG